MKINKKQEGNIIIAISTFKKIISIFLGPFLTAYFIKTSKESLIDLSLYHIFSHVLLTIGAFAVANIIKNKFRIGMFRIGVISNLFYIMAIIILKQNIINHLVLISILYGISASTYWFPYNLFVTNRIDNKERTNYTVKAKIVSSLTRIICPFLLGSIITATNYELTAIIILFVTIIQIILSFLLEPEREENLTKINYKNTFKELKDNEPIRRLLKVEFLAGMNNSDTALEILITILIFNSFKTNLNLGLINSITAILSMVAVKIYGKKYKNKNDKNIITISSIMPVIAIFLLLIWKNNITIIIYNIFYVILVAILTLTRDIRLWNISDSSIVKKENQCEFLVMREAVLNLGRILGYLMLLIAGLCNSNILLNIILILLTLSMPIMGINIRKLDKYET